MRKKLPPEAYKQIPGEQYVPYIKAEESFSELTLKSLFWGAIFGILFGMANAYLGLMAGLTISTAIPLSVITVAVARGFSFLLGKSNILENNITKTAGSASSSLASGLIFTIPALYLWGQNPGVIKIALIGLTGGLLGVLFMIPLRSYLIKEEHGNLPYPEGIGSAEVFVAAEAGGDQAKNVFTGLGIGFIYSFFMAFVKLWKDEFYLKIPFIKKAVLGVKTRPALLGVGYILGFRISLIMVSGGLLAWLVIIPIIAYLGEYLPALQNTPLYPATDILIKDMTAKQIWTNYIRYIGAGAVATAGFIALFKSIPVMISSFKNNIKELSTVKNKNTVVKRTDIDLPFSVVIGGAVIIILILAFTPVIFDFFDNFWMRLITAVCVAIFAFFFTTVSARIVGLVGVTSNPTSGMIIATLIGTSIVFFVLGMRDLTGKVAALTVGAIVGVAASIAGDTSQDLKTGFLIGATPSKQQIAEIVGVITTAFFVALSIIALGKAYGFGTEALPAPQANMMKLVIDGVLGMNIPWTLVLIGVAITLFVHFIIKIPSLAFAIGVYLPVSTMVPIFIGGFIRHILEKKSPDEQTMEERREKGILFSSGLVGGDGLMGVIVSIFVILKIMPSKETLLPIVSFLFFGILVYILYKMANANPNERK